MLDSLHGKGAGTMKDLITHDLVCDSYNYILSLIQTDEVKNSPYAQQHFLQAARRLPIFFTMDHPKIEWAHFTSYMGCIALREYDNPAISDLYYLHELVHSGTLMYKPEVDFYSWRTNTLRNELYASLISEAYVYFEVEGLRGKSFEHEIWVDRFLKEENWVKYYQKDPEAAQERLRSERKLISKNPNPFDFIEQQIAGYFHQNMEWAEIWRKIRVEIDEHMSAFVSGKITVQQHAEWVISKRDQTSPWGPPDQDNIPFFNEACLFYSFYDKRKKTLSNELLR